MTQRSRHEPASGAKVSPDRRALATWAATPTVKASTRNDGRLTLVGPHRLVSSTVSATTRSMPEKSAVESDVRLTSS